MSNQTIKRYLFFPLILIASCALAQAQQKQPQPSLTQPTSITRPVQPGTAAPDVATPSYEPIVGGSRGILVETLKGDVLMEQMADVPFNPASGVKILTALTALRSFGADYRYTT